jgi:hypothetical protein
MRGHFKQSCRHDGRDTRASHFIRINHVTRNDHSDHDYPYKTASDHNGYKEV